MGAKIGVHGQADNFDIGDEEPFVLPKEDDPNEPP